MTVELSPAEIRTRLQELHAERALASICGFGAGSAYMADLEGEIEATNCAYVGAAVAEIATLRGQLSGPLVG